MIEKLPLVSVCIPVYNRVELIKETIQSVLNQDYPNLEIVVQDNASNDGTWEWLEAMAQKYSQLKIEQNEKNLGSFINWNLVMRRTRGDYAMWLSSDDMLEPGFIVECIEAFAYKVDAVTTNYSILKDGQKRVRKKAITTGVYQACLSGLMRSPALYNINCTLFSREAIERLQKYGNLATKKLMSGDYDLWFRFMISGFKLYYIAKPLGIYRIHEGNDTKNKEKLQKHTIMVLLSHHRVLKKKCGVVYRLIMLRYLIRTLRPGYYEGRLYRLLLRETFS